MASMCEEWTRMKWCFVVILSTLMTVSVEAELWSVIDWTPGAHATWYGGTDGSGTMGGACGYGNLYSTNYGDSTTALSTVLFNDGLTCGGCFELQCVTSQTEYCYPDKVVTVTATNSCPHGSYGGWCDGDKPHFDLSHSMFTQLAEEKAGHVPVLYKRVPCSKVGGLRFTIQGHQYWTNVLVTNMAGEGTINSLFIKGSGDWNTMSHNWGASWQSYALVAQQALSFLLQSGNGQQILFSNVASYGWSYGQTYEANSNTPNYL